MLIDKIKKTKEFYDNFSTLLRDKPYTLQKCSLHGTVLVKEIIARAREEANEECQQNLAKQVKELKMLTEQLQNAKKQQLDKGDRKNKKKNDKSTTVFDLISTETESESDLEGENQAIQQD